MVKRLIHVLWAIEKDLRVIASNTKVLAAQHFDKKTIFKKMCKGELDGKD
ncbi:hypothetical protein HFM82_14540 [Lactobacillus plantarum]|nr:hypothetical protein [Lactiplantibacillus plantarum]MBE1727426.1 hypothetical protein [Lactiplantibacillus plantarum]NKI39425.1 hypothetical protein [Lactiplantibacillus plantarum]